MTTTQNIFPTGVNAKLPTGLQLGPVHLTVPSIEESLPWYEKILGLAVVDRSENTATLAVTDSNHILLALHEDPAAQKPERTAGLYHVALNYRERIELARVLRRIAATGYPMSGASDHGTHEALYLSDPNGIGFELAWDRERADWQPYDLDGRGPQPLDLQDLLSLVTNEELVEHVESEMFVGHVHLHIGDLAKAKTFWIDTIGFELVVEMSSAMFVSAAGYHHHLGMNLWRGSGIPGQVEPVIGLREWRILLPDPSFITELAERLDTGGYEYDRASETELTVRDPWNMLACFVAG